MGYDVGVLELGERVDDELDCGEFFDCVRDSKRLVSHAVTLRWTGSRDRRNPALGLVVDVATNVRERVWWVHAAFTLTLGYRQVPPGR